MSRSRVPPSRVAVVVATAMATVAVGCTAPQTDEAAPVAPEPDSVETPDPDAEDPAEDVPGPVPEEREGPPEPVPLEEPEFDEYPVPTGSRPHDVAPGPDGRVWYTAQHASELGVLEPGAGGPVHVPLGDGARPHGVIVGPDGAPWITDGGLNAIVHVDPDSLEVTAFPLPRPADANLNTAAFDHDGVLWFTGQAGVYGRLDPDTEQLDVFDAPRGGGPYGIAATPDGTVWFSSLAGSYIARIEPDGSLEVVDVPTEGGGARRVWSDRDGRLWVTEWFAGNLARYDPAAGEWDTWRLPGDDPQPYAVYVDADDQVWVTDFGADALVRFDPDREEFRSFPWPTAGAQVRQLLGVPGEVWGAGSATDTIVVLRTHE